MSVGGIDRGYGMLRRESDVFGRSVGSIHTLIYIYIDHGGQIELGTHSKPVYRHSF